MKLYIVSTKDYDYDEYDSFVIAAKSQIMAKKLATKLPGDPNKWEIEYIGEYNKEESGVIHSSFNAG